MTLKIGLKLKINGQEWTLTDFSDGMPLITCKATRQAQRVTDKDLGRLIKKA